MLKTTNTPAQVEVPTMPSIRDEDALIAAEAAVSGDWSKLAPAQRVQLYGAVCTSLGLNPLTQPFGWFSQGGKLVLYAFKGATDQLRRIHGVDVVSVDQTIAEGLAVTTVQVRDHTGRSDMDIGAVALGDLKGEARANAFMKSITKAKRRATLSLVGLGMPDESEIESISGARRTQLDLTNGEILGPTPVSVTATVSPASEPPRNEVKKRLWELANKTYGWDQETLEAVAYSYCGQHLRDMDTEALMDLHVLIASENVDERASRVQMALEEAAGGYVPEQEDAGEIAEALYDAADKEKVAS